MRIVVFLCLLLAAATFGQASAASTPLFADHSLIRVKISGPVTTLTRERPDDQELPATFAYTSDDGSPVVLDVKLRTRGNFRRDRRTCPFPPVRINFVKRQVKGTTFAGQDKLKLVTHCRNKFEANHRAVHREYLAYRVLNTLTDASFRVRLLEIEWVDAEKNDRSVTEYGFLIEDVDELAERLDREELEIPETSLSALDPAYTNLTSIFQLFIANTDFSPIAAAPGQSCCHNGKLIGKPGQPIYAVPYDFDMSGFVDAPYATPNPRFGLRNVKQRLYRGRCVNNEYVPATLQLFRDHRDEIVDLIRTYDYLEEKYREETIRYVDAFYELINDPAEVNRRIIGACLG